MFFWEDPRAISQWALYTEHLISNLGDLFKQQLREESQVVVKNLLIPDRRKEGDPRHEYWFWFHSDKDIRNAVFIPLHFVHYQYRREFYRAWRVVARWTQAKKLTGMSFSDDQRSITFQSGTHQKTIPLALWLEQPDAQGRS